MICQEHLDHRAPEEDAFLYRIVTGDESRVYHYESESKRQLMQWKHPSSMANKGIICQVIFMILYALVAIINMLMKDNTG
jgi:hypothetical protein